MVKLTRRKREKLPSKQFACPDTGNYPIHDFAHIVSARAYYRKKNTLKCKGGKERICGAAKKLGLMKLDYKRSSGWKKWCHI